MIKKKKLFIITLHNYIILYLDETYLNYIRDNVMGIHSNSTRPLDGKKYHFRQEMAEMDKPNFQRIDLPLGSNGNHIISFFQGRD